MTGYIVLEFGFILNYFKNILDLDPHNYAGDYCILHIKLLFLHYKL